MKEIWKEIKGYESLYEISNLGRVKSHERYAYRKSKSGLVYYAKWPGRILTPSMDNCGYMHVRLSDGKRFTLFKVHTLVANAFIHEYDGRAYQVHHINHDKTDNRLENLKIITKNEHALMHKGEPRAKRGHAKVYRVKQQKVPFMCVETGKIYESAPQVLADDMFKNKKMYTSSIYMNLKGKIAHHRGFHFKRLTSEQTLNYYKGEKVL